MRSPTLETFRSNSPTIKGRSPTSQPRTPTSRAESSTRPATGRLPIPTTLQPDRRARHFKGRLSGPGRTPQEPLQQPRRWSSRVRATPTPSRRAATQQRIQGEAGYNKEALGANQGVLEATAQPVQMEANLSGQQGNLAGGALSTEQKAGETPEWVRRIWECLCAELRKYTRRRAHGVALN